MISQLDNPILMHILSYCQEGGPRLVNKQWRALTDEAVRVGLHRYGIAVEHKDAWSTVGKMIRCFESLRTHQEIGAQITACFPNRVTIRDLSEFHARLESTDFDHTTFITKIIQALRNNYPNGESDLLQTHLLKWGRDLPACCIGSNDEALNDLLEREEEVTPETLQSCLMASALVGSLDCVKRLTQHPDITIPNRDNQRVCHFLLEEAAVRGDMDIVRFLLSLEDELNPVAEPTPSGKRPRNEEDRRHELHYIGRDGGITLIEPLRELINVPDKTGVTPLIAACRVGNAAVVEELLRLGADPNARDIWRMTALDYCEIFEQQACFETLYFSDQLSHETTAHWIKLSTRKRPWIGLIARIFMAELQ